MMKKCFLFIVLILTFSIGISPMVRAASQDIYSSTAYLFAKVDFYTGRTGESSDISGYSPIINADFSHLCRIYDKEYAQNLLYKAASATYNVLSWTPESIKANPHYFEELMLLDLLKNSYFHNGHYSDNVNDNAHEMITGMANQLVSYVTLSDDGLGAIDTFTDSDISSILKMPIKDIPLSEDAWGKAVKNGLDDIQSTDTMLLEDIHVLMAAANTLSDFVTFLYNYDLLYEISSETQGLLTEMRNNCPGGNLQTALDDIVKAFSNRNKWLASAAVGMGVDLVLSQGLNLIFDNAVKLTPVAPLFVARDITTGLTNLILNTEKIIATVKKVSVMAQFEQLLMDEAERSKDKYRKDRSYANALLANASYDLLYSTALYDLVIAREFASAAMAEGIKEFFGGVKNMEAFDGNIAEMRKSIIDRYLAVSGFNWDGWVRTHPDDYKEWLIHAQDVDESSANISQGNISGNLNNGGFVATDGEHLFYSDNGGLQLMDENGECIRMLDPATPISLNAYDGYVYYVTRYMDGDSLDDNLFYTAPFRVRADGSEEPEQLGEYEMDGDTACAYRSFTLSGEHLYFISANDRAGTYKLELDGNTDNIESYEHGYSVYRMNLDGSGREEIVADIGNAYPKMSIADGRIYVQTSYEARYSEGHIVDYMSCDLDGKDVRTNILGDRRDYAWGRPSDKGILSNESSFFVDKGYVYTEQANGGTGMIDTLISAYDQDGLSNQVGISWGARAVAADGYVYFYSNALPNEVDQDSGLPVDMDTVGIYRVKVGDWGRQEPVYVDAWFRETYDGLPFRSCSISVLGDWLYIREESDFTYGDPIFRVPITKTTSAQESLLDTDSITEEGLKLVLSQYTTAPVLHFVAEDYDGDGNLEAFAIIGVVDEDTGIQGNVYFVDEYGVQDATKEASNTFQKKRWGMSDPEVWDLGDKKFFATRFLISQTNAYTQAWEVSGRTISGRFVKTDGLSYVKGNLFSVQPNEFDGDSTGMGRTEKTYYLFWNGEEFIEHGGIEVGAGELKRINGMSEIIEPIEAQGCKIVNGFLRANGVVNINYRDYEGWDGGKEYFNRNLMLSMVNGRAHLANYWTLEPTEDFDSASGGGIYKKSSGKARARYLKSVQSWMEKFANGAAALETESPKEESDAGVVRASVGSWSATNEQYTFYIDNKGLLKQQSGEKWTRVKNAKPLAFLWLDDEYLYYIMDEPNKPLPDGYVIEGPQVLSVWRMNLETEATQEMIDYCIGVPYVCQDYIFWQSDVRTLTRMGLDGGEKKQILQAGEKLGGFWMSDGYIIIGDTYYTLDGDSVGSMKPENAPIPVGEGELFDESRTYNGIYIRGSAGEQYIEDIYHYVIANGGIYYLNWETERKQSVTRLYFADGDGSRPRRLDAFGAHDAGALLYDGRQLYFFEMNYELSTLYEMDEDGKLRDAVYTLADAAATAHHNGNWIFFYDDEAGYNIRFNNYLGKYSLVEGGEAEEALTLAYSASSTLPDSNGISYSVKNLYDGKWNTAWAEGVKGVGIGETVTIKASEPIDVIGFEVYTGYGKDEEIYHKNARAKVLALYADGEFVQNFSIRDEQESQRFLLENPVQASAFEFRIEEVYKGSKYTDTCISELELLWD